MNKRACILFILLVFSLVLAGALFACAPATVTVDSMTIVTAPTRTYFLVGEELDLSGATVNIVFENGQSRIYDLDKILKNVTISGFDSSAKKFNQTVTVSYDGKIDTFTVDIVNADDVVDITFDSAGGSEVASAKAVKGKPLGAYITEPTPTKSSLSFAGWYASGSTYVWGFNTDIVTDAMTLTAKWNVALTFVATDGSTRRTVTRQYQEGATVSQAALDAVYASGGFFTEKSGYTRYWKVSDTDVVGFTRDQMLALADAPADYFTNLTANKTLYCVYVAQLYQVYIQFNGATALSDAASVDFPKWSIDRFADATDPEHIGQKVVERAYGTTLDIGRPGKAVEITGSGSEWEGTYDMSFEGWYTDAAFTQRWDKATSLVTVDGMTLYARFQWSVNFYPGTLNGSEGPGDNILPAMYFDDGETFDYTDLPQIPTTFTDGGGDKSFPTDGYTSWWSHLALRYDDGSDSSGTEYESKLSDAISLETMLKLNGSAYARIYANFYHIPYTLTLEDFSSSAPTGDLNEPRETWYGRQIATIRGTPSKTNLHFKAWYLDKELTVPFSYDTTTVAGTVYRVGDEGFDASVNGGYTYAEMTLYAGYVAKISFIRNAGNPDDQNSEIPFLYRDIDMVYKSDGVYSGSYAPPIVTAWAGRDGYWFYADASGVADTARGAVDFANIVRDDIYSAYYVTKQYAVTYVADCSPYITDFPAASYSAALNGADRVVRVTYDTYAASRDTAYYVTKNGGAEFVDGEGNTWIIEGWYKDSNFLFPYNFTSDKVLNDVSIYAKWIRRETEGLAYVLKSDGTYAVSAGSTSPSTLSKLVVPAKHDGKAVSSIVASAFSGYAALDKIYIAESVTLIEANAFRNCSLIATLPVFNSSIELGLNVFYGTAWLAAAEADDSTADKADFVIFNENTIYKFKKNTETVVIPTYISIIGAGAFQNKTNLTSITLHNGVVAIRSDAFRNCSALQSITFDGESSLEDSQLSLVGVGAFSRLDSLTTFAVNGLSYRSINNVLYRLSAGVVTELVLYPAKKADVEFVLPETVSSVADEAFYKQQYLQLIVFRSTSAPTIPADIFAVAAGNFTTLQALQRIIVPADDTYGVNNYTSVWAELPAEATAILKHNTIDVNYVSPVSVGTYPKTTYAYGDALEEFVPTNAYLTFDGWYLDAAYTIPVTAATYVKWDALSTSAIDWGGDGNKFTTKTFDVYAKWTAVVVFHIDTENAVTYTLTAGDMLSAEQKTAIPLYDKTGYTVSWHYDATETLDLDSAVVRGGDLYVAETLNTYNITYMSHKLTDWVQYGETETANYGAVLSMPTAPAVWDEDLSYLVFSGWYQDQNYQNPWVFGVTTVAEDTVLYGRWLVPMSFIYTDIYEDESIEYALYKGNMVAPEVAYAYGYAGSWKERSGSAPDYVYTDAVFTNVTAPKTYYAVYVLETYTVSFVTDGVGSVASQNVTYGDYAQRPTYTATQSGKVFAGWFLDAAGEYEFSFSTNVITEDTVLYAYWVASLDGSKGLKFYNATGEPTDYYVTGISVVESVAYIPSVAYNAANAVIAGSSVYKIGADAFNGNANIKHLIIPTSITEIAPTAFVNMPNLERITVIEGNANFVAENGVLYSIDNDGNKLTVVKVPAKVKLTNLNLPETVTEVASYAFEGVENVVNIHFASPTVVYLNPNALKNINAEARFFVSDKNNFLSYTNSPWAPYADRMYSEYVAVTYKNPLNTEVDFSGAGYTSTIAVLSALSAPTATPANVTVGGLTYVFGGWTTDAEMLNLYDFSTELTDNLVLYARWQLVGTVGLEYKLTSVGTLRGYRVAYGSATAVDIVIENFHNGLPVLAIASSAFVGSPVESVYIPSTVIRIADTAFASTVSLASFVVSSLSTSYKVVNNALYSYDSSTLVVYPAACDVLTEFRTEDATTSVGQYAFYNNAYLQKIVLAENVSYIGYAAFGNSSALTRIEVLNTVPPAISADPFYNTNATVQIYVPGSNFDSPQEKSIADLYRDRWIDSDRAGNIYPLTVRVYFMLDATTSFNRVGGTPYTVDADIFTKIAAPSTSPLRVGEVFVGWFDQVYGGNKFSFADTELDDDVVLYAHWQTVTNGNNEIPPYLNYVVNAGDKLTVSINTAATGYAELTEIVVASSYYVDGAYRTVTTVAADGFRGLTALRRVVLPYTLTAINANAFYGCTSLEEVNIPGSVTSLGEGLFYGCSALKEIEFPATIASIAKNMMRDCASLQSVVFWGDITYIGEYAFSGCALLDNVDLGDNLVYLMARAFAGCIALQNVRLPATLKSIGSYAFYNDTALKSVSFAEGTTLEVVNIDSALQQPLGLYVFYGCSALVSANLPEGLSTLPDYLFAGCASLTAITIPYTVNTIGVEAFRNCRKLATVDFAPLPVGVTSQGLRTLASRAFMGCSVLKTIVLAEAFSNMGIGVFAECVSLERVTFLSTSTPVFVMATTEGYLDTPSDGFLYLADKAEIFVPTAAGSVNYVNIYKSDLPKDYTEGVDRVFPMQAMATFHYLDNLSEFESETVTSHLSDVHLPIEEPEAPSKEGFVFGGWAYYKDGALTTWKFDADTMGSDGVVLYARWIVEGTTSLAYNLLDDGTMGVSRGTLYRENDVVIANYYYYQNEYRPVTRIEANLLSGTMAATLYIPETVKTISDAAFTNCLTLQSIAVASDNAFFRTVDGVLYDAGLTKIIRYPAAKDSVTYAIASSIATITEYSFESVAALQQFTTNDGVTRFIVEDGVLYNYDQHILIAYPAMRNATVYTVPSTVTTIYRYALTLAADTKLTTFEVESGNVWFTTDAGVLFKREVASNVDNTDKRRSLVRYPAAAAAARYTVPLEVGGEYYVTSVGQNAFRNAANLIAVEFDSVLPVSLGADSFADMSAYILVPSGALTIYKTNTASNWSNYSSRILRSVSVLTFDFNNGDASVSVDVDTLDVYPSLATLAMALPTLAYSSIEGWYDTTLGTKIVFDQTTAIGNVGEDGYLPAYYYVILDDTTLRVKWEVSENVTEDLQYNISVGGDGYVVRIGAAVPDAQGTIIIPSYYNGLPVVGIAEEGFINIGSLKKIVLPETVTAIGSNAFSGCNNLVNLTIMATVPPSIPEKELRDLRDSVAQNGKMLFLYVRHDARDAYVADGNSYLSSTRTRDVEGIVSFDPQNSEDVIMQKVVLGVDSTTMPAEPTGPEGKTFIGWYYMNGSVETSWDFMAVVEATGSSTVYAVYAKYAIV